MTNWSGKLTSLGLAALLPLVSSAGLLRTETFEDQNFNGWIETNGPRSIVTNHVRAGTYAGKHTLIGQVGVNAGYKNESWRDRIFNDVGEYWIGFSVYIVDGGTEDWIFDQYSHDSIFFQVLHAPDYNLGETGKGYPIKMHIRGDEFTITHGGSTVNPHTSSSRIYTSSIIGPVVKGQWHDFVLYMKFDPPNPANCAIKVWHNGALKVDKSDFVFGNEGPGYHVKFGIYQPDWRTSFADVDKRWIYHDEIRIGDSNSNYNEVAPTGSAPPPPPPPSGNDLVSAATYATASSSWNASNIVKAHDDDTATGVGNANDNVWIEYDLGGTKTLDYARVWDDNSGTWQIGKWKLQYFDGSWHDAFGYTAANSTGWNEVNFTDVSASKIRFYFQDDISQDSNHTVHVYEVECYEASTAVSRVADEDAFVRGGSNSANNYGSDANLKVKDANTADVDRQTYLKFDLNSTGLTGCTSAKLRLYCNYVDGMETVTAFAVTNDGWTESNIRWNNKPPSGSTLQGVSVGTSGGWYEWDVTSFVDTQLGGDGIVSIVLKHPASTDIQHRFNSREASTNKPVLMIE